MKLFTEVEDKFIRDNYLQLPAYRMGKILGRRGVVIRQRMKLLGLEVPPVVKEKFIKGSFFKAGHTPFNSGMKLSDYVPEESREKMAATQFKRGHLPHNTKDRNLAVSTRRDNRGVPYKFIRVSLGQWVPLQRYNWERVNGPLKRGENIVFKDGDTMNCDISNLELLNNAELMKRNTIHNYPGEVKDLIRVQKKLEKAIVKQSKKVKDEK